MPRDGGVGDGPLQGGRDSGVSVVRGMGVGGGEDASSRIASRLCAQLPGWTVLREATE